MLYNVELPNKVFTIKPAVVICLPNLNRGQDTRANRTQIIYVLGGGVSDN